MKYLLLCALFLSACTAKPVLSGEVFITKPDGSSLKLGNLDVHIFKKSVADELGDKVFLHVSQADYAITTNSDGKFSVELPAGSYNVVATGGKRTWIDIHQKPVAEITTSYRWNLPVEIKNSTSVSLTSSSSLSPDRHPELHSGS